MSLKPTEPRSIASQLVLLFTISAAVLFCCGLGMLYWIVVRHAFEEDDMALRDRVVAMRADLARPSGARGVHEKLQMPRAGERVTYWVRLARCGWKTLGETPGMEDILPADVFPAPTNQTLQSRRRSIIATRRQVLRARRNRGNRRGSAGDTASRAGSVGRPGFLADVRCVDRGGAVVRNCRIGLDCAHRDEARLATARANDGIAEADRSRSPG